MADAEAELRGKEQRQPGTIGPDQLRRIQALSSDLHRVWYAATTTDRDRKQLLRTLLEEVTLNLKRAEGRAQLTLRWRGGAITTLDVPIPRFQPQGPRTDEDTISLLRRLAVLYPDEVIAGIFNRQGRKTATENASPPIMSAACAGTAISRDSSRRPNHPTENWSPSARQRRSSV